MVSGIVDVSGRKLVFCCEYRRRKTVVMEAQLVLIGGRSSVPNVLTLLYQRPEIVLALTSKESTTDFPKFKRVVEDLLPSCSVIEELPPVDAFEREAIEECCQKAFERYPDAHWVCNITVATTIMSIAVYEQAKKFEHACWYVNTAKSRVIALVGPDLPSDDEKALFHLEVKQYVESYYFSLENGDLEKRRDWCEHQWLPFAQMLGKEPHLIPHLKSVLQAIGNDKPKSDQLKGYNKGMKVSQEAYHILKKAEQVGLVNKLDGTADAVTFTLTSLQYSFLNGGWLETYVWSEAREMGLFDDCQWNHKVTLSKVTRELDVALTYKAQLLIAECKTGRKGKNSDTFDDLLTVANRLGAKFVGKIFISSLFSPEEADTDPAQIKDGVLREKIEGHQKFLREANHHHIVVIMAEDLPRIRERLEAEAKTPEFPRI
jgi:hypothetical protein